MAKASDAGDISSVVAALGDTFEWPAEFAELKQRLRPDPKLLQESWQRLDAALERELAELKALGQAAIPVVSFADIQAQGGLPKDVEAQVRKRGVVIVRNVVEPQQARDWKTGVQDYAKANPDHIGFPKDDPQVLELYWSKPQVEARQHENMHKTMLALNRLWQGGGEHVSFDHVFAYGERLRIRKPGEGFFLHPHTDGGSIERFEDEYYQKVYEDLWKGQWESYDPWGLSDDRAMANVAMYQQEKANGYCSVFRAFQGWMAVSSIGAENAGTLKVLPLLKEATAHIMLRPFLGDVPAADFCGAVPGMAHDVTRKWHQRLHDNLIPIPAMQPGDTVWWHADIVHAVEHLHNGTEDSSVFYIPSFPATRHNMDYVRRQRDHFRQGKTPPDFPPNDSERHFVGRATEADLTPLGRRMLGLEPLSVPVSASTSKLIHDCNAILGFHAKL